MDETKNYISRLINGLRGGSPLKPTVAPESLSSLFLEEDKAIMDKDESYKDSNTLNLEGQHDNASINLSSKETRAKNINSKIGKQPSSKRDQLEYDNVKKYEKPTTFVKRNQLEYDNVKKYKKATTHFPNDGSAERQSKRPFNLESEINSPTKLSSSSPELKVRKEFNDIPTWNNPNSSIKTDKLSRVIIDNSQEKRLSEKESERTVTINIGKITVRTMNASDSYYAKGNEAKEPKKLSLNDYMRKRKGPEW